MSALFIPVPGWWVDFTEPDEAGEKIPGFYITEERGRTFHQEPGFRPHQLSRVYVMSPHPINEVR